MKTIHHFMKVLLIINASFLVACFGSSRSGCSDNCGDETDRLAGKKDRLQSFLSQDIIPIIDVQTTLTEEKMNQDFPGALTVMDDLGLAKVANESYGI